MKYYTTNQYNHLGGDMASLNVLPSDLECERLYGIIFSTYALCPLVILEPRLKSKD